MTADAIIYLVDDDESVRKAVSRLFRAAGFDVVSFESANEFLDFPISNEPSCVILDHQTARAQRNRSSRGTPQAGCRCAHCLHDGAWGHSHIGDGDEAGSSRFFAQAGR